MAEADVKDTAVRITAPLVNRFKARLEQDAFNMLRKGKRALIPTDLHLLVKPKT